MSSSSFDDVLMSLQGVQNSTKLLQLLIEVKERVDVDCANSNDNITKIRESGSFKQIISSLQTSKERIIKLSLSILGHCCLDVNCAREMVTRYGILSNLNQLLIRYPKEDSINGRVFKIVGNLCQHKYQWTNNIIDKEPEIVIHIVKFLNGLVEEENGEVSEATVTMGVRSLRELLCRETLETLVVTYGVPRTLGTLLIKYGTIWQATEQGDGVVLNIIKGLHEFSRYTYYPSILDMRNTGKGDSIVYLSKILFVAPLQVAKIVMNVLRISQSEADLPLLEIFDSIVKVLRDESIIQEFNSTCEDCIRGLCYLLDYPENRENEKFVESIPVLMTVLKGLTFENNRKIECCLLILSTLNKCTNRNNLITAQINSNAVTVLTEKIKLIVGAVQPLNFIHNCNTKKTHFVARFKGNKKLKLSDDCESSSSSDEEFVQLSNLRYNYSPGSSNNSVLSWTSALSPLPSPQPQFAGGSETSGSGDYFPVCSEFDDNDVCLPLVEPEPKDSDDSQSFNVDSYSRRQIKKIFLKKILDLLKTYVRINPPITQFEAPDLLLGLIRSSGYFDWAQRESRVEIGQIVCKIFESDDYLLPLMKTDFIPYVCDYTGDPVNPWCSKCRGFQEISKIVINKISERAESDGGKGDIAHKLLRGDIETKQQLALVIPYIIRDRCILLELMLDSGGLEILMQLLKDDSPLQNKCIQALCVLASKRLCIPNPQHLYIPNKNADEPPLPSTVVTFKLDDGSLVSADRDLLSKKSDFFARLLDGDFKESCQDVITLPNVAKKALVYLLQFMNCDIDKDVYSDLDLHTHLDVIALCDRFLLEDCIMYLTNHVWKFRLRCDTIPTIYNWSMKSRTNLLRTECVTFALVGYILDQDRFEMFKKLFELGYIEELLGDIKELLVRYLSGRKSDTAREK